MFLMSSSLAPFSRSLSRIAWVIMNGTDAAVPDEAVGSGSRSPKSVSAFVLSRDSPPAFLKLRLGYHSFNPQVPRPTFTTSPTSAWRRERTDPMVLAGSFEFRTKPPRWNAVAMSGFLSGSLFAASSFLAASTMFIPRNAPGESSDALACEFDTEGDLPDDVEGPFPRIASMALIACSICSFLARRSKRTTSYGSDGVDSADISLASKANRCYTGSSRTDCEAADTRPSQWDIRGHVPPLTFLTVIFFATSLALGCAAGLRFKAMLGT